MLSLDVQLVVSKASPTYCAQVFIGGEFFSGKTLQLDHNLSTELCFIFTSENSSLFYLSCSYSRFECVDKFSAFCIFFLYANHLHKAQKFFSNSNLVEEFSRYILFDNRRARLYSLCVCFFQRLLRSYEKCQEDFGSCRIFFCFPRSLSHVSVVRVFFFAIFIR